MKKNLIFLLLATVLLVPWPVAYAYDNGLGGQAEIRIEAAAPAEAPSWQAYGNAIGGVTTPGDLFYLDATTTAVDTLATLYMTNADELSHYYRYLILQIGVYARKEESQWEKATLDDNGLFPDTYLTMRNGRVEFPLPGYASYKLTIDGGSFYCFATDGDGGSVSPEFYVTAE